MKTSCKYTEDEILCLWKLWTDNQWLKKYPYKLEYLFSVFAAPEQRELVSHFLREFKYVTREEGAGLVTSLANRILDTPNLCPKNAYLIPRSFDKGADGSKKLLYDVLRALNDYDWEYSNVIRFRDIIESSKEYEHIVVLDDFVGSGCSMVKTIEWFRLNMDAKRFESTKFYAYCLAGMESAKEKATRAGYFQVEFEITLKEGISQLSNTPKRDGSTLVSMQQSVLKNRIGGMKLDKFYFGYADAEALYYSDDYRVPNSVFPLFWWRQLKDSSKAWKPMFEGR